MNHKIWGPLGGRARAVEQSHNLSASFSHRTGSLCFQSIDLIEQITEKVPSRSPVTPPQLRANKRLGVKQANNRLYGPLTAGK